MNKRLAKKKVTIGVGDSKRRLKAQIEAAIELIIIQEKANKQALDDIRKLNQRNTTLFDEKTKLVKELEQQLEEYKKPWFKKLLRK